KVSQNPNLYFTFNDSYFLAKLHEYLAGRIMHPMIRELSEMLAQRKPPAQIKIHPVQPTLVENENHRQQLIKEVTLAADWLKEEIRQIDPEAWMIFDIPKRDVMFTKNKEMLSDIKKPEINARDSVRILTRHNELKLLIDVSNSLTSILSQYRNFIPRIYVSPQLYEKLEKKKVLDHMRSKTFK
ncbi:MAG: hypothetical protein KDD40_07635, partial [Bdellovibrionales bacterium]|nr:hypothetical protein [Bdellovibrionales bacterium]